MSFVREEEFLAKRRHRNLEYVGLIAFQSFFATRFFPYLNFIPASVCLLSVGGLAWTLGRQRERRRTLPFLSRARIMAEVVESLVLMFVLVLSGIVALKLHIPMLRYQSYICLALLAFFAVSFLQEMLWQKKFFSKLDDEKKNNYTINLSKSIIFPYSIRYLRRVFGSRRK